MRKSLAKLALVFFGAMLAFTACNVFGPDDKAVVSEIQAKLFQDSVLKTRDIRVTANKGMVILTGTVNTELEKSAAERLAGEVGGVKQVENQLSVAGETAQASQAPAAEPPPAEQPTPVAANPEPESPTERKPARVLAYHQERRHKARQESAQLLQEAPPPSANEFPSAPAAPAQAAPAPASTPAPPPPPKPVHLSIPAGTIITVQMIDSVDSSRDRAGQDFQASVEAPVVVGERVVIPRGADARVRLVSANQAGHMTGTSELALELSSVTIDGNPYTTETSLYQQKGSSRGKRTAETVGGGAVLGGLIGAIAGHGKGAAIGSVLGAGAGTAAEAGTKAAPVRVSSETKLDFTLRSDVSVTLSPSSRENRQQEKDESPTLIRHPES